MATKIQRVVNDEAVPGGTRITTADEARKLFFRRGQATGDLLIYLDGQPRGRLLELPAGEGKSTLEFLKLGYDVVPGDLFPHYYKNDAPPCVKADMGKPLPFADASFDYIVCQEGIEHIEAPLSFTRECSRVLKPGGQLILTTPNILHMTSRLAYFLVGHRTFRSGMINEYQTLVGREGPEMYHGHAWHWRYPVLRYILRLSGFAVQPPKCTKYSWTAMLFSLPMYPILYLAKTFAIYRGLVKERRRENVANARRACHEIRAHLMSPAVLWGRRLVIIGVKEANPEF